MVEGRKPAVVASSAPSSKPSAAATAPSAANAGVTAEVAAWTEFQDALLLGLKALGKTWKQIEAMVEGKDLEDLRDRFAEIMAVKDGTRKAEAVVEGVKKCDPNEEQRAEKIGDKKKTRRRGRRVRRETRRVMIVIRMKRVWRSPRARRTRSSRGF